MVPSAFTKETGRDHWEVLLRARAIETQCWVVAAATTGRHEDGQGPASGNLWPQHDLRSMGACGCASCR